MYGYIWKNPEIKGKNSFVKTIVGFYLELVTMFNWQKMAYNGVK